MNSFRTPQNQTEYKELRKTQKEEGHCALCEKPPMKEYEYWKIIKNDFPYDRIAKTHNMIVSIRHASDDELNQEELNELKEIKKEILHSDYEFIIETTYLKKSIPEHFHLHLIISKDDI